MNAFVSRHAEKVVGVLSCFDRVVFKGYLPIAWAEAFERYLGARNILRKDFKPFVRAQAERLKAHAQHVAARASRPFRYLQGYVRKEDLVRKILREDGVTSGLVCVLSALEPCQSFVLRYGKGKPRLESAPRQCTCLYFYFLDPEFGPLHIRIQTWFPFTIQICLNGHDWLARKMDRHGISYRKVDNAFVSLSDPARAQRFADAMAGKNWPRILGAFARRVNPLLGGLLSGLSYYWVTDQAEYATDVMFQDRAALEAFYPRLLRHATLCLSAEDVLTFLGRKLHGNFQGEVLNDAKRRLPGARVKHRMKQNWIKMYDKFGVVLRIETVINRPYEFHVRRRGKRKGQFVTDWFPLTKGVAFLPRYQEVALAANTRYLEALAGVEDPTEGYRLLNEVCEPATFSGRSRRGLHPLRRDDVALFAAALRGEHAIHGFRNRHLAELLDPSFPRRDKAQRKRLSARVTRLLQLLRAHALVAKIPRSRRYRLTSRGHKLMGAAVYLRTEDFPDLIHTVPA